MPRYARTLTYRQVVDLLRRGVYEVCLRTGRVTRAGREVGRVFPAGDPLRAYVRLYADGRRKMVRVACLVWMAATRHPIPRGWQVHHKDLDPRNDAWANLVCLHPADHRKEHQPDNVEEIPF